jgi:hypothetical protein
MFGVPRLRGSETKPSKGGAPNQVPRGFDSLPGKSWDDAGLTNNARGFARGVSEVS